MNTSEQEIAAQIDDGALAPGFTVESLADVLTCINNIAQPVLSLTTTAKNTASLLCSTWRSDLLELGAGRAIK